MRLPARAWRIGLKAALGVLLGCLAVPEERAVAAGPSPGTVAVGQVLQFTLGVPDANIPIFDGRDRCSGPDGGPLVYHWTVAAPLQSVAPPEGVGETFAFSVTVADSPGFIFPVDVSLSAICGVLFAYSANAQLGNFTIASPPPPPPPPPPTPTAPTTPATPKSPAGPASSAAIQTCRVAVDGQRFIVYLRGTAASCDQADDIARARVPGWACVQDPFSAGRRYVTCQRAGAWGVALPASGGACAPVTHRGLRYRVFGARVLCQYARATALRMLRRQLPYVVESIRGLNAGRWHCRIFGQGANERGLCHKLVEDRWLMYVPAGA